MTYENGQVDQTSQGQPAPQGPAEGDSGFSSDRQTGGDHGQRQDSNGAGSDSIEERRFTQADVDRIARDRASRAERAAEKRVMRLMGNIRQQPASSDAGQHEGQRQQQRSEAPPRRDQFANDDDYLDARFEHLKREQSRESAERERQTESRTVAERVNAAYRDAAQIPGFSQTEYDALDLTSPIVHAVLEADADVRGKLMHYMQEHPDEVERISRLPSAIAQAKGIARLEARLSAGTDEGARTESSANGDAPQRQPSRAPRPGTNVGSGNAGQTTGDLSRGSMADYLRQRTRQGAKWAQGK